MNENLLIRPYEKDDKENLLEFYRSVYPYRSPKYLSWWVNKADKCLERKNRTYLLINNCKIVGATSGIWDKLRIGKDIFDFYWAGNTIIDDEWRGHGGGRLIYSQMAKHNDRISTGFTEKAFKIQPRLIPNLRPIPDVFVYLSLNSHLNYILKVKGNSNNYFLNTPEIIQSGGVKFQRAYSFSDVKIKGNGDSWTNSKFELCRDSSYIEERFFNCYRPYWVFNCTYGDNEFGYMVIRPTYIKGIRCLSLVDFRYTNIKILHEIKRVALKIAKLNKICILITLTSLTDFASLSPLTIKLPKKLHGATSIKDYVKGDNLLITSADSDLDFVYYP